MGKVVCSQTRGFRSSQESTGNTVFTAQTSLTGKGEEFSTLAFLPLSFFSLFLLIQNLQFQLCKYLFCGRMIHLTGRVLVLYVLSWYLFPVRKKERKEEGEGRRKVGFEFRSGFCCSITSRSHFSQNAGGRTNVRMVFRCCLLHCLYLSKAWTSQNPGKAFSVLSHNVYGWLTFSTIMWKLFQIQLFLRVKMKIFLPNWQSNLQPRYLNSPFTSGSVSSKGSRFSAPVCEQYTHSAGAAQVESIWEYVPEFWLHNRLDPIFSSEFHSYIHLCIFIHTHMESRKHLGLIKH